MDTIQRMGGGKSEIDWSHQASGEQALPKQKVVALVGPTSSGKTALSLALAERINAEVIACDSRTVYRYMDIGTAKPSAAEQSHVRHHLLDVVNPDQSYTAALYKQDGARALEAIRQRGNLPLVCGGTGFYARALLCGLDMPQIAPQPELRQTLRELAERQGNQALHEKLAELDPLSAARINVNDRFRLIRALEVCLTCGQPFSSLAGKTESPYETIWIGLTAADRSQLYKGIQDRFAKQMAEGMLEEVAGLLERFGPSKTILNTINYRELAEYLQGKKDRLSAEDECIRHNCQLARKQLIWFRANPDITWFYIDELSAAKLIDSVSSLISSKLMR